MPLPDISPPPAIVAPAPARAGRGGLLLPSGYLHTKGAQIVDAKGRPVRIASIGWNGTDGAKGATLNGLWAVSYRTVLRAIVDDGFNTVRIPWTDVGLNTPFDGYTDRLGWINTQLNEELLASREPDARGHYKFVTTLAAFKIIVAYAKTLGLKVIFDHHSNEGTAGQQKNGLWFDLGPGSNGSDGIVQGSVTAERFMANWLQVARAFAGDSTVIGYDLDNEPNGTMGNISWGGGGPRDIKLMYEKVGAAIQAIDPGPLIICEGPEEYTAPTASSGMDPNVAAPEGDLTAAGSNPVILPIPHKVVYSVHEYPNSISAVNYWNIPDSGAPYVERMNKAWGFLVRDDIAPVWIGEMGSALDTPGEHAWAQTLFDYMEGKYVASGGPAADLVAKPPPRGAQESHGGTPKQPVSGSWWAIGYSKDTPYGVQTQWGAGHFRPEQQLFTDRMLMRW